MEKFTIENVEYELPDLTPITEGDIIQFRIEEGEHQGSVFEIRNIQMDNEDASLMNYDLFTSEGANSKAIEPIAQALIMKALMNAIESAKTE